VAFLALLTVVALRRPWVGDFGLHAAVIERLRANLIHPGNPQIDAEVESPYFSPYMVILALVAKVTGLSGATVLTLAAPFTGALLLYGLGRFVRLFTTSPWAPVLALPAVLLLWGPNVTAFSGFLALRGLPLLTPYPSTVAMALMLLCWVATKTALDKPTVLRWLAVGALGVVIVLIHPFTAVETALGVVAFIVSAIPALRRPHVIGIVAAGALAGIVAVTWPYFSVFDFLAQATDLDAIHRSLYTDIWGHYGFGLVLGLPAVAFRLRRSRLDPLGWLAILAGVVVAYGGASGHYAWGRVWPVLMLAVQISLALELLRAHRPALRGVWAVATVVACAAGIAFQYGNLLLALPADRLTGQVRLAHNVVAANPYRWADHHLTSGEIMAVADQNAARILLRDGVRFVVPPWPEPLLEDTALRVSDQKAMLDAATPEAQRKQLFASYHVNWVLDVNGRAKFLDQDAKEILNGPGRQRLLRIG
jgi:hypothetical protein